MIVSPEIATRSDIPADATPFTIICSNSLHSIFIHLYPFYSLKRPNFWTSDMRWVGSNSEGRSAVVSGSAPVFWLVTMDPMFTVE